MIVWLNGTRGAGLSLVGQELVELMPGSTFYDPELTAAGLRGMLPRERLKEVADERDLPSWRRLVVDTAAALLAEVGGPLIVPAPLLRQEYRDEIFGRLAARRIAVRHMLLHLDETILRDRLSASEIRAYDAALPWLAADAHLIDASRHTARQSAERVVEAISAGAGTCDIVQTPEPTGETLAAGVLLFDEEDRVLLVDPTYKAGWEFPGGVVEAGEAPARAGLREVAEELGLSLDSPPRLLVVDWEPPRPPGYGGLRLLFDGGRLQPVQMASVLLPGPELRGWRFVTEQEAAVLLPPVRYKRLHWALRARELSATLNLEAGVPVG